MNIETRKALVIGATGLIGKQVVARILENPAYEVVNVLARTSIGIENEKLHEYVFDINTLEDDLSVFKVDDIYCCIGTTIRKAGSRGEFEAVDLRIPLKIATIGKNNGVSTFILVSSIGADVESGNFYLRTKGRVEEELEKLQFKSLVIMRPSILLGKRNERRFGEWIGKFLFIVLSPLLFGPLKKYRCARDTNVARAMIHCALSDKPGKFIQYGPY